MPRSTAKHGRRRRFRRNGRGEELGVALSFLGTRCRRTQLFGVAGDDVSVQHHIGHRTTAHSTRLEALHGRPTRAHSERFEVNSRTALFEDNRRTARYAHARRQFTSSKFARTRELFGNSAARACFCGKTRPHRQNTIVRSPANSTGELADVSAETQAYTARSPSAAQTQVRTATSPARTAPSSNIHVHTKKLTEI